MCIMLAYILDDFYRKYKLIEGFNFFFFLRRKTLLLFINSELLPQIW